jgi:hypothetical protein
VLTPSLYVLRKRLRATAAPSVAASAEPPGQRHTTESVRAPDRNPAGFPDGRQVANQARETTAVAGKPATPAPAPASGRSLFSRLLYRNTALGPAWGVLAVVGASGVIEYRPSLQCERVHFAGGMGVCLRADRGLLTTYSAQIFDESLEVRHTIDLPGGGSRARVAPDGKLAAVTVFVSGHSYADATFSTATTLIDTGTGVTIGNLEEFLTLRDGAPWRLEDFNFWGVTFAKDSNTFFVTLSSGGRTFLARGSVDRRRMEVVREGVECPSLSPDGARIAFKRVVERPYRHWVIAVLDLGTMQETLLTEKRNVDDQVDWLDDDTILYGLPETESSSSAVVNTWMVDRRGARDPTLFLRNAASTVIVR